MSSPLELSQAFSSSKHILDLGELKVVTGQIVACDVMALDDQSTLPFIKQVEPGNYKVQFSILEDPFLERTIPPTSIHTYARIKFSDSTAVRWELALKEGQKAENAGFFRGPSWFFMDTATAGFMDLKAHEELIDNRRRYFNLEIAKGELDAPIHQDFVKNRKKEGILHYANWSLNSVNIVAFTSGNGEGFYPCYWGYDEKGQLAELIADFNH